MGQLARCVKISRGCSGQMPSEEGFEGKVEVVVGVSKYAACPF
jgi:hypothetical protein